MYRILLILINIIYLIFLIFILIPYYLVKLIYIGSLDIINYIIKLNKKDGKFDIRYNDKSYKKYEIKGHQISFMNATGEVVATAVAADWD